MKTSKTQDQLYNRIVINFGIGILAYSLLYFLYQKLYMKNTITFILAGLFLVAGVVCFAISKKKHTKNYGYMFLAFALCLLFTRLSVLTVIFIGFEKFLALQQESYLFKKLMQTDMQISVISWLGAIYLMGMFLYNLILMKFAKK